MVQLVLLKGADKDVLDNSAWTPLYLTSNFGRSGCRTSSFGYCWCRRQPSMR